MIHQLKILPVFFDKVISGEKTFELRNNDREYNEGNYLALNEWEQTSPVGGHYTGRSCLVYVDYILHGAEGAAGLDEDYVVMAIKPCGVFKVQDGMRDIVQAPERWNKPQLIIGKSKST